MDITQVTRKRIPIMRPTDRYGNGVSDIETMEKVASGVRLRSIEFVVMFMRRSGRPHTMERATDTAPAAKRVKLKNHQKPINLLDGIL